MSTLQSILTTFQPVFVSFAKFWPVLVLGFLGAIIPKRSRTERIALSLLGVFTAYVLIRLWPEVPLTNEVAQPAEVYPKLLSLLLAIPIVGALIVLFTPRQTTKFLQLITLFTMGLEFLVSLWLLRLQPKSGFWLEENIEWIQSFGIRYHVGVDGISLWLILLTTAITPIAVYVSFGSIHQRLKEYCFSFLLLLSAMVGSFVALDLFLFYVMWELMLIPMYILIGVWGSTERIKASIKFFIYTMTGSMLMLAAILFIVLKYRALSGGVMTWDLQELQRLQFPITTQRLLFFAFALAFLIKVPMFPVHTWLPDAHTQAPTGASIVLAAVMLKVGCYGYMRFAMGLFPHAAHEIGATLAGIAVLGGILYGALCAFKQNDIKRLVAYSSVSHLGYVMLGIFARNTASTEGAILQMINHGISTGALFLLVGVIYDRRHTREVSEFGGLAKVMPWYATIFMIVTFSSIGLPGTNGFVGEWLIISGSFMSQSIPSVDGIVGQFGPLGRMGRSQAMGAAIGVILGAVYMLTVAQKVLFGQVTNSKNKHLPDLTRREVIALAPLVFMIFVIGFFPRVFTEPMHKSVSQFLQDFEQRRAMPDVPEIVLKPTLTSTHLAQNALPPNTVLH